jgi:hypothetical protein
MTLLAATPALPLHTAGPYVAAAYIVFVALILVYVSIMAIRLSRTQRDLAQLKRDAVGRQRAAAAAEPESERDPETVA